MKHLNITIIDNKSFFANQKYIGNMKRVISSLYIIIFLCNIQLFAQLPKEDIYIMMDSALMTQLVAQYPDKLCEDNNEEHTYMGNLNIGKVSKQPIPLGPNRFEDQWMIFCTARADHESQFSSGSSQVQIMAQIRQNFFGKWEIIRMKWKKNECMQYATLYDREAEEKMAAELNPYKEDLAMMDDPTVESNPSLVISTPNPVIPALQPNNLDKYLRDVQKDLTQESELKDLEKEHPGQFLQMFVNLVEKKKKKDIGQLIDIRINNHAENTTYKDVKFNVHYLTKTETILKTEEHIIYEYFEPGKEFQLELDTQKPLHTEKVSISFMNAIPIYE